MSSSRAADKAEGLMNVLDRYFPHWQEYDGKSDIKSVETAITYVVSKKRTKAVRKAGQASAELVLGGVGAAIGGVAGSVVLPGVGTAGGALAVGNIVSAAPTVGIHGWRKFKALYKLIKGTKGVHRHQAAKVLFHAYNTGMPTYPRNQAEAAAAALLVILGDEADTVLTDKNTAAAEERIYERLKSW